MVVPVPVVCVKLVATTLESTATASAELIRMSPKRTVAPMVSANRMSPVPAVKVSASVPGTVPLSVLLKVILPAPAPVLIATDEVNVTPVRNEIKLLVVVILPPRELRPTPSWMNVPVVVMSAPLAVVNRPALVTSIVVPTTLAPAPLMLRA